MMATLESITFHELLHVAEVTLIIVLLASYKRLEDNTIRLGELCANAIKIAKDVASRVARDTLIFNATAGRQGDDDDV